MSQRSWNDVHEGDKIEPVEFPLPVCRLIVAAGANRDFNAIHHNSEYARATGAPEMYANTLFLQGMWERAIRDYIGLGGTFRRISGFRMKSFNCAGETVVVRGEVRRKWLEGGLGLAEIKIWSENGARVTVGPGMVTVTLPLVL